MAGSSRDSSWENPNYNDTTTRSSAIVATNIFFTLFATIVVLLRMFTRHKILRSVGVDDWLILLGLVLAWVLAGWNCIATGIGLGRHKWDIRVEDYTRIGKVVWGTMTLYIPVVGVIKLSILFSLRRVTPSAFGRQCIYAMMAVVGGLTFATGVATLVQCTPLRKIYTFTPSRGAGEDGKVLTGLGTMGWGIQGRCVDREALLYVGGGLNIVSDLVILGIPIPMLLGLGLPRKQKVVLVGVFSLGGVACIASMARLAMIRDVLKSADPTWVFHKLAITSCLEISLGIICASIPTLKPFLSRYIPSLLGVTENRYSTNGGGPHPPGSSRGNHHHHHNPVANKFGSITIPSRAGSWYTEQEAQNAAEARERMTNPHKYRKLSNGNTGGLEDDDDEANVDGERPEMAYVRGGAITNVPKITYTSLVKKKPVAGGAGGAGGSGAGGVSVPLPPKRKMTAGSNSSSKGYGRLGDGDDDDDGFHDRDGHGHGGGGGNGGRYDDFDARSQASGETITIMHYSRPQVDSPFSFDSTPEALTLPPRPSNGSLNSEYQESPVLPPHKQLQLNLQQQYQQGQQKKSQRPFPTLPSLSTPSPTSTVIFTARSGPLSPPSPYHATPPTSSTSFRGSAAPITSALSTLSNWGREKLWSAGVVRRGGSGDDGYFRTEDGGAGGGGGGFASDADPVVPRFNLTRRDTAGEDMEGRKLVMVPAHLVASGGGVVGGLSSVGMGNGGHHNLRSKPALQHLHHQYQSSTAAAGASSYTPSPLQSSSVPPKGEPEKAVRRDLQRPPRGELFTPSSISSFRSVESTSASLYSEGMGTDRTTMSPTPPTEMVTISEGRGVVAEREREREREKPASRGYVPAGVVRVARKAVGSGGGSGGDGNNSGGTVTPSAAAERRVKGYERGERINVSGSRGGDNQDTDDSDDDDEEEEGDGYGSYPGSVDGDRMSMGMGSSVAGTTGSNTTAGGGGGNNTTIMGVYFPPPTAATTAGSRSPRAVPVQGNGYGAFAGNDPQGYGGSNVYPQESGSAASHHQYHHHHQYQQQLPPLPTHHQFQEQYRHLEPPPEGGNGSGVFLPENRIVVGPRAGTPVGGGVGVGGGGGGAVEAELTTPIELSGRIDGPGGFGTEYYYY